MKTQTLQTQIPQAQNQEKQIQLQTQALQKQTLPLQARLATLEQTTEDSNSPIFSVVFSTGERVRRCDICNDAVYDEELAIDVSAIRLGRLNSGAPVLDTHEQASLANIIGVVVPGSVRIEDGIARASIRLHTGDENASTISKVRAGIIRNVSVGYVVHKFEVNCEKDDAVPLYRATDWEPYEISLVPIGADSGAGIARAAASTWPCEIVRRSFSNTTDLTNPINSTDATNQINSTNQPKPMTDPKMTTTTKKPNTNIDLHSIKEPLIGTDNEDMPWNDDTLAGDSVDVVANIGPNGDNLSTSEDGVISNSASSGIAQPTTSAQKDGIKLERSRVLEIQKIVQAANLPESFSQRIIESGTSVINARKLVLDKLAQNSATNQIRSVRVVRDEMESRNYLVENALLNRHNPDKFKLDSAAREFRGMSMMEIGRDILERRGVKTYGLSRTDLAAQILGLGTRSGYMGTSDFPYILSNIANKTLREAYESAPQTFKPFCRKVVVSDFKMVTRLQMSDAPSLDKVNEAGEFKYGSLSESQEKYQLFTYGKVISLTRQTIINDDLDAFTRIPALFGQAAADLESDIVWSIITGNPPMGDNIELFHAKHSNVSSAGSTISIQSLGAAREALRKQKGLNGRFINVTAKYLMVPCSLETIAQQFMATGLVHIKNPDVNPFAGSLQVIAEPRLDAASATAWYMAGDPSQIDTIEYAYLEGHEGVHSDHQVGFDVDGIRIRVRHDFGAKATDWRGFYKNGGMAVSDKDKGGGSHV